ncbi:MAG: hypothetical protein LBB89_04350 [Treponema sp.]|nr:hypothetical protein [Treponema sp.]
MNSNPAFPSSYEYIHYTAADIETLDLNRTYLQTAENLLFHTPNGLWLSICGINDWEIYSLNNNDNLDNLKYEFQVKLKPHAQILMLYNNVVFEDFEKTYAYYPKGIEMHDEEYTLDLSIKWQDIINDYQGIALPNIIPKLYNMGLWFDTWCCTSACIWDLQAVEKVEKLTYIYNEYIEN